jgi:hypothetical protein
MKEWEDHRSWTLRSLRLWASESVSYNERTCFMGIFLQHYLAGHSCRMRNIRVQGMDRLWGLWGPTARKNMWLNHVAYCLRIVYKVIPPSPSTLLRRLRRWISILNHFRETLRPWRLFLFFLLSLRGRHAVFCLVQEKCFR